MNEADIWQSDYNWINKEMGMPITKRQIRKVSFKHDGKVLVAEVGKPNPYNGQPIRKIYEAGVDASSFVVALSLSHRKIVLSRNTRCRSKS